MLLNGASSNPIPTPWREKQKRGEKFEYRWKPKSYQIWNDWCVSGSFPSSVERDMNDYEFAQGQIRLGPEDVMPGQIVRYKSDYRNIKFLITQVDDLGEDKQCVLRIRSIESRMGTSRQQRMAPLLEVRL